MANINSKTFGYCRVSSTDQKEDRQLEAMLELGINERDIFVDKCPGKNFDRPQYQALKVQLREGDILVIKSIDRLGRNYKQVCEEWRLACPHSELNLVFPNSNGNYQSADNLAKRRFLPALNRAGIDKIRFHDLRHTYASLLLANGAPMKYVQHLLGHSSITMTMDLYTHLLLEVNDKCVNLLNNIVNQSIESQEEVQKFGT